MVKLLQRLFSRKPNCRIVVERPEWDDDDRAITHSFFKSRTGKLLLDNLYHSLHVEAMKCKPKDDFDQGKAVGIALTINMVLSYSQIVERERAAQKQTDLNFEELEEIKEKPIEAMLY